MEYLGVPEIPNWESSDCHSEILMFPPRNSQSGILGAQKKLKRCKYLI